MSDYKVKAILPNDMELSEFCSRSWTIKLPMDSVDDFLKSEMYKNVSVKMNVYDVVKLQPSNETFYAELLVSSIVKTSLGVNIPSLTLLRKIDLKAVPEAANEVGERVEEYIRQATSEGDNTDDSPYEIRWQGRDAKHAIIRKSDRMVVETGISRKADALERIKALAA